MHAEAAESTIITDWQTRKTKKAFLLSFPCSLSITVNIVGCSAYL